MNRKPLVSVITIFLNAERYIREAIESIFAQTYTKWELLLVDDGSEDESSEIARHYAEQYTEKVQYLDHAGHQNRGMSASRNLGIKKSQGEYIAFLDADDVWLPNKLEEQVAILRRWTDAAMVYGRTLIWYSWTKNPDDLNKDHMLDLGVLPDTLVEPPKMLILLLQNKVQNPTTCNAMIRRKVFDEIGGFQEKFMGMFEDQAFFVKVLLDKPVFVSDTFWAKYRQHPDSCCSVAERTGKSLEARRALLNWSAGYFTEKGVTDAVVWKTLQKELWPYRHPVMSRLKSIIENSMLGIKGRGIRLA